jgi:hypothetical protein
MSAPHTASIHRQAQIARSQALQAAEPEQDSQHKQAEYGRQTAIVQALTSPAAWPLDSAGVALRPGAELPGEQITMKFVGRGINTGTAAIALGCFVMPTDFDPGPVRITV